ncbi:hypothetical protein [Rhizobium sp. BK176]|uniref:hypothetical protein n=1 Tax=Rhizobium sp. BK176 TaxID=2587071 RepID=UPI002169487C|nr:hypothetical protein [Rhizobium sp. BK176]MCS4089627.1 hypothetical protein [Rhizobium sp. BK176]
MTKVSHFTATVPLLVLAEGVPPGSRFKKMCLSIVDCDVSFKSVGSSDTSVAFTIPKATEGSNAGFFERYGDPASGRQNILIHGDSFYQDVVLDAKELVKRMQTDPFFRPGRSSVFREEMLTAVQTRSARMVWPDHLYEHARKNRLHFLDGIQKTKAFLKDAHAVKHTDEGLEQIEEAKRRFRDGLSDVLFVDGRVHTGCGEPLYLHKPSERHVDVRAWDSALWTGSSRPSSYVDAHARFFPANRVDDVRQSVGRPAPNLSLIEVVDEGEIRFPLEEMEYHRIACKLVANVEIWLGKRETFSKANKTTLNAYADLRDLVQSVDPLVDGVPAELEEKFEAMVACVPCIPKVDHEVYVSDEDIDYARGMWENRPISASVAPKPRKFG